MDDQSTFDRLVEGARRIDNGKNFLAWTVWADRSISEQKLSKIVAGGLGSPVAVAVRRDPDKDRDDLRSEQRPMPKTHDPVLSPAHYTSDPSGVECIQVTQHRNFPIGNAIKYLWRAGLKPGANGASKAKQLEDLRKAIFYIETEIKRIG